MAPNPKVAKAFRAMREIGISEEIVKPVLKKLLKLYDKKWELIEEENYRALADAIFDSDDTTAAEQNKKANGANQEDHLKEAQVHDEPERPLKRLRLKHQSNQDSMVGATSCPEEELIPRGKQPVSPNSMTALEISIPSQPVDRTQEGALKRKGKEPLSPQIPPRETRSFEKSSRGIKLKEPKPEPGIVVMPKQKVLNTQLIQPKDEPITDDTLHFEVPIAIIPPEPPCQVSYSIEDIDSIAKQTDNHETPSSVVVEGKRANIQASSSERVNTCELENIAEEESLPDIEVASSPSGEVKISLSCNLPLSKPGFHMPSLDAVLKSVEDRCLRTYKISDPNFSVRKLMRDMCDSFLELGTTEPTTDELIQEKTTIDSFETISGAPEIQVLNGVQPNGLVSIEVALPEVLRLQPSLNGMVDHVLHENKDTENGICGSDVEKETEDENLHSLVDVKEKKRIDEKSGSLVVSKQDQLTADQMRSFFDRNDITRGEEIIKISMINEVNKLKPPSFHYIPKNIVFQNAYVNFSLARIGDEDCCSTCFGDCLSSMIPCACARETGGEFAYTSDGLVKEELLEECISMNRDPEKHKHFYCKECPLERSVNDETAEPCKGHLMRKFIKECWSKCGCTKQCGNRVVQRGISRQLQVFMTAGKGWGIRTLEELPKGAFVCEYVGEILTNSELYDRNKRSTSSHSYPVLLDADWGAEKVLKDEEALCLDATFYGNVARFLNHRCLDANMVEIPVEVETPDHHYYHLAFFTTRKVDAKEELTWDYGIDFDDHDHPVKAFRCKCGSKFCRNMKRSYRSRSSR